MLELPVWQQVGFMGVDKQLAKHLNVCECANIQHIMSMVGRRRLHTYIYFHLLIQTVVHYQAVSDSYSVRFHGMPSDVCIIAHVRIVEVRDFFGFRGTVRILRIERCTEIGRHDWGCVDQAKEASRLEKGMNLLIVRVKLEKKKELWKGRMAGERVSKGPVDLILSPRS